MRISDWSSDVCSSDLVPRVDYVLAVRGAGYAADDAPGFASMLAGLLAEGSDRHDSKQIAEAAQGYGGSVGANASSDGITVYGNALASNAAGMMQLLAEDRKSVVSGTSGSVRVDLGGRRIIQDKTNNKN